VDVSDAISVRGLLSRYSLDASLAEVPIGYSRTDIGMIPEEWECRRLGELTTRVGSGITPTGGARVYTQEGRPFLRSQNIGWGVLNLEDLAYISDEIHATFRASEIRDGDVLLNITGASIGRSAVADGRAAKGNVNQHVCGIRTEPSLLDPKFLNAYLLSESGQKQIDSFQAGGNRQGLNYNQIRSFLIPRPPITEQHAIAEALSDVDELLSALETLIAKKRAIKQGAMQQLLSGKTRLPGFDGKWTQTNLGAIGECVIGLTYRPENVVEHGLLVLRASNIQNGRLTYDDNVFVNLAVPDRLITRAGDILVCVRNGSRALIGKSAVMGDGAAGLTFGAFMCVYRTKQWRFIAHAFQGHSIQRQIRDNIGATINQITNKDMKALSTVLPCENEQIAIADVLSNMDAEISALKARRDKTRAIKQGMMQQLLTGRIRLVKPQPAEAKA
jgi:type I restriction enzyme, S subunit